jgi:hypothetical protein
MKNEFLTTKLDRRTVMKTVAAAGVMQIASRAPRTPSRSAWWTR